MMLNKNAPTHSTEMFSFSNNTMIAEASDFRHRYEGQIYLDSADAGFFIKSERTGKIEAFRQKGNAIEGEDIVAFVYEPHSKNLRDSGFEVHILND